jgi:hypothetical protein
MATTATAAPRLGFCICWRNDALQMELQMPATPKGLSDEKAARMMVALREGRTLKKFGVKAPRLEAYFAAHLDYAREARPLITANATAARLRKGDSLRTTTHCRAGLHLMTADNVFADGTHGRKHCLACRRTSSAYAPLMSVGVAQKVKGALEAGASLSQITSGKLIGGGKKDRSFVITSFKIIKRYRRENPDFDRFVVGAIADSNSVGQKMRRQRKQNETKREEINDYHRIRAMLPAGFPDKDDVVSAIFEDLLAGCLKRDEIRARVSHYVAAHNRMFPTNFAKFGDRPLVSLDEAMFDDGATTRGDTVSRSLWD